MLSSGECHVLLDAGISCRRICAGLGALGLEPGDLTAILITHTHADHIAGLQTLLKRTAAPVLATVQAARDLAWRLDGGAERLGTLSPGVPHAVGDIAVTAFPTSHDAPGSCGFRLDTADGSVGVLTDTGYVTDEAAEVMEGVDLAVLEANHDKDRLRSGPYPYYLKLRILGSQGHLSNADAARFSVALAESGASEILLAHLSRENNTPELALSAVEEALAAAGLSPALSVAPRETLGAAHLVGRRRVCRR